MICLGIAGALRINYELVSWFTSLKWATGMNPLFLSLFGIFAVFLMTAAMCLFAYASIDQWSRCREAENNKWKLERRKKNEKPDNNTMPIDVNYR
jgi:hypothetical protein